MRAPIASAAAAALALCCLSPSGAWAGSSQGVSLGARPAPPPAPAALESIDERVPLGENFSTAEAVTIGAATAAGVFALAVGPRLVDPKPSIGPPAADSFDRRVSDYLYGADGTGSKFWGGVPDVAGFFVLPYLPALFYGGQTLWHSRTGSPFFPQGDRNPDHRLVAYIEALGWTIFATGITKMLVGRTRPYAVLGHPEIAGPPAEQNVSFFSAHSSATFCAAAFAALDASDTLRWRILADAPPVRRFLLGTLLPYTVAFGAASVVGISRIVDQQHFATDVLLGAGVGTLIAHLAYVTHFDHHGRPRRRVPGDVRLVPAPNGLALAGLLP